MPNTMVLHPASHAPTTRRLAGSTPSTKSARAAVVVVGAEAAAAGAAVVAAVSIHRRLATLPFTLRPPWPPATTLRRTTLWPSAFASGRSPPAARPAAAAHMPTRRVSTKTRPIASVPPPSAPPLNGRFSCTSSALSFPLRNASTKAPDAARGMWIGMAGKCELNTCEGAGYG